MHNVNQQPQVLPIANLDFDKLAVVFVHKHPKEWPCLCVFKISLFLLSLFSIFSHFWTFNHVLYLTSPSLICCYKFCHELFELISSHGFAYIINHKQSFKSSTF